MLGQKQPSTWVNKEKKFNLGLGLTRLNQVSFTLLSNNWALMYKKYNLTSKNGDFVFATFGLAYIFKQLFYVKNIYRKNSATFNPCYVILLGLQFCCLSHKMQPSAINFSLSKVTRPFRTLGLLCVTIALHTEHA